MRIAWIIGGLALAVVLGVVVVVEDGGRLAAPSPVEQAADETNARPELRGAGPQPASAADASDGEAPTAARVQGWIGAAARVTVGSPEWDRLRRLLDVRFADFGPHMTLILEACLADAAERRAAGAALLAIALDARRLHGRLGPPRPPAIPRPSPLSPDHFDLALEIATSARAQEAAAAIFANLKELGPQAHTLIPHAMAWCATERSRYDEYVERMKLLGVTPDPFPYRGLDIVNAIGQLGPVALTYLAPWVAEEESHASIVVSWIGLDAEPAVLSWMRSADAQLQRGALRLAADQRVTWSEDVIRLVRARLRDPMADTREEAARTLTTLLDEPAVIKDLVWILRGKDTGLRRATLEALGHESFGLAADSYRLSEAVVAVLSDPSEEEYDAVLAFIAQRESVESVAEVGLEPAARGLLRALAHSQADTDAENFPTWLSLREPWRWLGAAAWAEFWTALHAADKKLQWAGTWAMAWNGKPDAKHRRLLSGWLVQYSSAPWRTRVASALAAPRQRGVVQALLSGLRAETWSERGIAAVGIGRLEAEGVAHLAALAATIGDAQARRLLGDELRGEHRHLPRGYNPTAMAQADDVLRYLARRDLEAAYDLSGHEASDVRKLIRGVLLRGEDRSLPLLARRWAKATHAQRVATLVTIAQTHDRSVLTREFRASFKSEDQAMRLASAGLIFTDPRTTADTARASDVLAEAAVLLSDRLAIRAETALLVAVAYKRQAMAVASLQRYRTHEDPAIRERALRIIHGVEHPPEALQPRVIR